MAKIAILSGNHLCHNPRVVKEATALSRAGHEVVVLGAWFDPALKARDRALLESAGFKFLPVLDLAGSAATTRWRRLRGRMVAKGAAIVHRTLGIESVGQLGYAARSLIDATLRTKADLYIAHSEAALAAASALAERDRRIGMDLEDWFSEDLSQEARSTRPLRMLKSMERELLRAATHATCTSGAMSEALVSAYGCRAPVVVYNAFPWADRARLDGRFEDRKDRNAPSIHWFSQTLGPGRGLEDLVAALPKIEHGAQLHLRGRPTSGFSDWLRTVLPENWRARTFVHDLVTNDKLLSRIAEHDIGFAGELRMPLSRDLTVTNKLLQYLQGGLAVVASETRGQAEIARLAGAAVSLYANGDLGSLANTINALLRDPGRLAAAKAAALAVAENTLSWEHCARPLLDSVAAALE